MDDLRRIVKLARFQVLWYIRSVRLWILLILMIMIAVLIIILPYVFPYPAQSKPTALSMAKSFSDSVSTLVILSAVFMGADAISIDFEGKTAYFLFPNPIKRSSIFLAKYIGSYIVSASVIILYFLIGAVSAIAMYGTIPVAYLLSIVFSLIYLASFLSLAYLFSSMLRSSAISAIMILFVAIIVFPAISFFGVLTGTEPWYSLSYGGSIISLVYKGKFIGDYPHVIHTLGETIYYPYIWEGLSIMLIYLINLTICCHLYSKQEGSEVKNLKYFKTLIMEILYAHSHG